MGDNLYRVYRRGDPNGAGMDWAVSVTDHGLEVRFGPVDGTAKLVEVPLGQCMGGDPMKEAQARTDGKLQAGYKPIGLGTYKRGRLALQANPAGGDASDELCWEARKPLPARAFSELVDEICKQLNDHGAAPALLSTLNEAGTAGPTVAGLVVDTPDGDWSLGYLSGGGLSGSGRGGGAIRRAQGVAPILVLLRVAREFPETLAFCDQNAEAITPELVPTDPWLGDAAGLFDATVSMAAAIGLCPGALPLVSGDEDEPLIWF